MLIEVTPDDLNSRAALAASYRAEGYDDQAGRWGLLVPGGSTEHERALFARVVAKTGDASLERARHLLMLPIDFDLTALDLEGDFASFPETLRAEAQRGRSKPVREPLSALELVLLLIITALVGLASTAVAFSVALITGASRADLVVIDAAGSAVIAASLAGCLLFHLFRYAAWKLSQGQVPVKAH